MRNYGRRGAGGSSTTWSHLKNCVEMKSHDITAANAQITGVTGIVASLMQGIEQGNLYSERQGRKVFVSSLALNLNLEQDDAGGVFGCNFFRVLVVADKQAQATAPAYADVMDVASVSDITLAFRNLENTGRFSILYDKRHMTSSTATAGPTCRLIKVFKKWKSGLHVTYDTTDINGTDIKTNDIWLIVVGDNATAANGWMAYNCRIRYTD